MEFLNRLAEALARISSFFYSLHARAQNIPLIGGWIGDILLSIHYRLFDAAVAVYRFADWISALWYRVLQAPSIGQIIAYLRSWLDKAETAYNWIVNATQNIYQLISQSLSPIYQYIQSAISSAINTIAPVLSNIQNTIQHLLNVFSGELELFRLSPIEWLKDRFVNVVLPWIRTRVEEFGWLWEVAKRYGNAIWDFFSDIAGNIWRLVKDHVAAYISGYIDIWRRIIDWWNEVAQALFAFVQDPVAWIRDNVLVPIVDDFNRGFEIGMRYPPEEEEEEIEEEEEE